jgi:hypothetical protein
MATVKNVIEQAYAKVNGEAETIVDTSDDFKTYLMVMNIILRAWADTPYVKWQSLFNPSFTLADVVAEDTFVYAIENPDDLTIANSPFDSVFFMNGTVVIKKFKLTDQALFQATNYAETAAIFSDGLHLKTVPEEIIGTTIVLPVYVKPPTYTTSTQTVRVDSVTWLVAAMAAFICSSSPVPFIARNADKYEKEADKYMKAMKANNKHRQHLTVKRAGQSPTEEKFSSLSQAINAGVGAGGGDLNSVDGGTF